MVLAGEVRVPDPGPRPPLRHPGATHTGTTFSRILSVLRDQVVGLAVGGLFVAVGLAVIVSAADILPTPDADFGAPRWIVGLAGLAIFSVGATIWGAVGTLFLPARWQERAARRVAAVGVGVLSLSLVVVAAVFLTLKLLNPEGAVGFVTVLGAPLSLPDWANNLVIRAAILLCLVALGAGGAGACWVLLTEARAARRRR